VIDSPVVTVKEPSRMKYELGRFLLGGQFDLSEDGRRVASIEPENFAAEVSYGKLILSCWGDGWSRSWRVSSCEVLPGALRLDCAKQMGRARCAVELHRGPLNAEAELSRAEFARTIATIIGSAIPPLCVESAVVARDDRNHFAGAHARLVIKDRNQTVAGIGVGERESQSDIDRALGAGLVWLEALRQRDSSVNRLMVFAPSGRTTTIATRLTAVEINGAQVSLFEVNEADRSIKPVAAFDQGDLSDRHRSASARADWPRRLDPEAEALVGSVEKIAPDLIETHRKGSRVAFSIRGLEFAHAYINRKRVRFGLGENKKTLNALNLYELEALVSEISASRRAGCENRNSPVFRAQPERWLEACLRRDPSAIDGALDPRYAYSQVPAYRGEQRSFIDLLAVTRAGRLVVIELKVSEDAEFPFQGLDYWLRVEWHRLRGDFKRRGYFEGLTIADQSPLLYLVAPLFRFHASTALIAGAISPRVPVYRIGINEDWRSRVRVLLSERLNPKA
jgi:hypothetical protein